MTPHLISFMVFLPLFGALLQAFVKSGGANRWVALFSSLASSFCAAALVISMQTQTPELQATETLPWVGSYAIGYDMGIDGLNVLPVLLIAILFPVLIAFEWNQKIGVRGMHGLLLVLQSAFVGTVCAQDLFLTFFFWGLSALPFYFLIGIWGGEKRESAAFRSIVSASLGNALLFAALILIYYSVDPHSFSIRELSGGKLAGKTFELVGYSIPVSAAAFGLTCMGLALRAPIWPLHGWFTHVAEEAPFSVFVALSAVSVPVATYLFIRLCYSLFPDTLLDAAQFIVAAGAVNLVLGCLCALAQKELRLLIAFICLSELGFNLIGIGSLSSAGIVGAVYQQLSLGLALAGFGLFAGLVTERLGHSQFIFDGGERPIGGIALKAPSVALVAGVVVASLLGFPGSGGFVGHSLLVLGSYSVHPFTVVLTGGTLLLATYYLFTMYRCVFLGSDGQATRDFPDLSLRERAYLLPLVAGLLIFGLYPKPLLELVRPTVLTLLSTVK